MKALEQKINQIKREDGEASNATGEKPLAPESVHEVKDAVHEINFVSYANVIYLWPVVVFGLLYSVLGTVLGPGTLAWVYFWIFVVVLTTYAFDLTRNQAIFALVSIVAMASLGAWLKEAHFITVFGDIYKWFASLDVSMSPGFPLAMSIMIGIPFAMSVGWSMVNDRWRFTHNELEHRSLGRVADSVARSSKTIRIEYPDVLEFCIALSGTIIIYDSSGDQVIRRIPNVLCLPLRKKQLDKILEQRAITAT